MLIIPAIDLYQGKVVRFLRGNPHKSTVYSDKPVEIALQWQRAGAKVLHVVDLSSALGEPDNLKIIEDILKAVEIKVEVGGGIRDFKKVEKLISLGAERVIIGTKGIEKGFINNLLNSCGMEKIAVSVDAKNDLVAIEGWQKETLLKPLDFIKNIINEGIKWIIYTDIDRDGTLKGVNLEVLKQLSKFKKIKLIISGGVSCIDDLKAIKEKAPFVWGVISGKALYDGKLSLPEAISLLGG